MPLAGRWIRSRAIFRSQGWIVRCTRCFIRAPWVERVGPDVQVLGRAADHIVAVRQGRMLATSFHPEMTGDRRIHKMFVDLL